VGNSLEKGAAAAPKAGSGGVSLQDCQRELPHVEAWAKAYASAGLGLTFPVALDNSYDTWNAYDNQSWPAAYLIDATVTIKLSPGLAAYSFSFG
jgi:hypothetical protein